MNNAGLPGTGIGGLFYLLLALWMPIGELWRTVRGRSSPERWRLVATQFALACAIIAALVATTAAFLRVADSPSVLGLGGPLLVVAPLGIAATVLAVLVVVLRVWSWAAGTRRTA